MVKRDIPESWLEEKPDIPPPRVEDKFERWHETYSVDMLQELAISDIRTAELEFRNKVEALKTEYRPGQLINPTFAQIDGKEPFTQQEFRKVRQEITDEAEQIRMNFKQARGRRKLEHEQRRANFLTNITRQVMDSFTNIDVSIKFPKLK
ncbi:hypothetical protein [Halorussus litoreus]|uniref:hypothetical protein n=1 Tax=Halorussus litoreus TaxID=1710536 RepID=UPI00130097A0|nr:hypothetical protein [Halorussus litoreus]